MKICIFCASSEDLSHFYYKDAEKLGNLIGEKRHHIIYGAGQIGLMGKVAQKVRESGGKTIGVIPERLNIKGVVSEQDTQLVHTKDMKERKAYMRKNADAFVALPGGFGTMEELLEVITLKQLQYHNKAIILLNTNGFYDKLLDFFKHLFNENFANPAYETLYTVVSSPEEVLSALESYEHLPIYDKFLTLKS